MNVEISGEQLVKIQNRMSDIRCELSDAMVDSKMFSLPYLLLCVGELLGTLDTVMFDGRNLKNGD